MLAVPRHDGGHVEVADVGGDTGDLLDDPLRDGDLPAVRPLLDFLRPAGKPLLYELLDLTAAREQQRADGLKRARAERPAQR